MHRLSTGIEKLDRLLGGGLLPGTMTVVLGATGIGKTQLGLQFANAGLTQEGRRGVIFDMTARGDHQNHFNYAQRMFGWQLQAADPDRPIDPERFFAAAEPGDYVQVFGHSGRRVTRRDLDFDSWHQWQADLARRLQQTIAFFYGNFVRGVRRAVIDGIEPVDHPSDSIQVELLEYIYHQILRKDPEWVARDLFRQHYLRCATEAAAHLYDPRQIACVVLVTSAESMLEALIERPLDEGDLLSNANTVILMGKIRQGTRFCRALYVAKHRGSAASDEIISYQIDDRGVCLPDNTQRQA